MSIENAILELAAAMRQVAEANQAIAAASLKTEESYRASIGAYAAATAASCGSALITDAELEKAVAQVETDAKAAQQKAMDKVSTGKQEIADALAKAKADFDKKLAANTAEAQSKVNAINSGDDPLADSAPVELDYEKDVKKKLVSVGKHKQEMVDLLKGFGVGAGLKYEKADKLPKEMYADVVAACDKILAARG